MHLGGLRSGWSRKAHSLSAAAGRSEEATEGATAARSQQSAGARTWSDSRKSAQKK